MTWQELAIIGVTAIAGFWILSKVVKPDPANADPSGKTWHKTPEEWDNIE